MKLQKLLVLADMAHLAQYGQPLFKDDVLAFENGLVVEKVWLRYRNDYSGFKADSEKFDPDFSEEEYETLKAVIYSRAGILGETTFSRWGNSRV